MNEGDLWPQGRKIVLLRVFHKGQRVDTASLKLDRKTGKYDIPEKEVRVRPVPIAPKTTFYH